MHTAKLLKRNLPGYSGDAMTDDQLREKIAAFNGFTNINTVCWRGHRLGIEESIPDYTKDQNAMFEAENTFDASEMEEYAGFLGIKDAIYGYSAVHCSAKVRANAYVRTITEGKSQL